MNKKAMLEELERARAYTSSPTVLYILDQAQNFVSQIQEQAPIKGQLFIDKDGDLCIEGREKNLVACPATGDAIKDWAPLNPDVFPEIVRRWNAYVVPPELQLESSEMPYRIFTDSSRIWLDDNDGGSLFAYVREHQQSSPAPAVPVEGDDHLLDALEEIAGCFTAAETEGLIERINEREFYDDGSIFGLVVRRLLPAGEVAREALREAALRAQQPVPQVKAVPWKVWDKLCHLFAETLSHVDEGVIHDENREAFFALKNEAISALSGEPKE